MKRDIPIYKIGAVLVRDDRVLLVRPKPKRAGELPPFVLPRGSRQYQKDGQWLDARDDETAQQFAAMMEPYTRALLREAEEEAGIAPDVLKQQRVEVMGEMAFQSRTKGIYPIYWFRAVLRRDALLMPPVDATETRWVNLDEVEALGSDFSAGYLPVIQRALGKEKFPAAEFD